MTLLPFMNTKIISVKISAIGKDKKTPDTPISGGNASVKIN